MHTHTSGIACKKIWSSNSEGWQVASLPGADLAAGFEEAAEGPRALHVHVRADHLVRVRQRGRHHLRRRAGHHLRIRGLGIRDP